MSKYINAFQFSFNKRDSAQINAKSIVLRQNNQRNNTVRTKSKSTIKIVNNSQIAKFKVLDYVNQKNKAIKNQKKKKYVLPFKKSCLTPDYMILRTEPQEEKFNNESIKIHPKSDEKPQFVRKSNPYWKKLIIKESISQIIQKSQLGSIRKKLNLR